MKNVHSGILTGGNETVPNFGLEVVLSPSNTTGEIEEVTLAVEVVSAQQDRLYQDIDSGSYVILDVIGTRFQE